MKAYFFDLDGTLTDSRSGLYASFRAALKALGIEPMSGAELYPFLGTPLPEMFRTIRPDVSPDEINAGIDAFRVTYEREGIRQNQLYPGVSAMLEAILRRGGTSWVVTSKPEHYAVQVVSLLRLEPLVAGVIGAGLAETDTKTDLIRRALVAAHVPGHAAVMAGDRHYDVVGAIANDVMPIGALWGYGTREELEAAGCRLFARSADEFRQMFVESDADGRAGKPPAAASAACR